MTKEEFDKRLESIKSQSIEVAEKLKEFKTSTLIELEELQKELTTDDDICISDLHDLHYALGKIFQYIETNWSVIDECCTSASRHKR